MQTGVLTIGPLTLNETNVLQDTTSSSGERVIQIGGRESSCDVAAISILKDNIMAVMGRLMPVQFQYKNSYNGYYVATDVSVDYEKWYQGSTLIGWSMSLVPIGPDNAVDIETRLANVVRSNNFSLAGERWHAPAIGHYGYYVGSAAPSSVTRQSEAGAITVYRAIPAGINPVWGVPVGSFITGRVRFLDNGTERIGVRNLVPTTGWELNNSLVRVRPATAGTTTLNIAFYDGTTWVGRDWDLRIAGDSLIPSSHWKSIEVTRADPEAVNVRIISTQPNNTTLRVIIDLLLRRGSRFVEGYIQRTASGLIEITPDVNAEMVMQTGYTVAPADDTAIRVAIGSSKTFIQDANGGIEITSTTAMDFWIGAEVAKSSIGGANGGFEVGNTSGWTVYTGATLTIESAPANVKHGTYSGKLVAAGGTAQARVEYSTWPITQGKQYTLSGWLMSPGGRGGGDTGLTLHWYNGGTYMSSFSVLGPPLSAGVWYPISGTSPVPPVGATHASHQFALNNTPLAGSTLYGDSLQIREATDSGDVAATLAQQYIGAMAEKTGAARR